MSMEEGAAGIAEGKADSLLMVIRRRFPEVSQETVERVRTASVVELDRWLERAVTAERLDDVWG